MKLLILAVTILIGTTSALSQNKIEGIGKFKVGRYIKTLLSDSSENWLLIDNLSDNFNDDLFYSEQLSEPDNLPNLVIYELKKSDFDENSLFLSFYKDTLYRLRIAQPTLEFVTALKRFLGNGTISKKRTISKCGASEYENKNYWQNGLIRGEYIEAFHFDYYCKNDGYSYIDIWDDRIKHEINTETAVMRKADRKNKENEYYNQIK